MDYQFAPSSRNTTPWAGARFNPYSLGLGIDYAAITAAAPRIQGREGRDKALYRVPPGIELSTHKLTWPDPDDPDDPAKKFVVFELRAGDVQDVLPPSIHPDTGKPYAWINPPWEIGIPYLPQALLAVWLNWDAIKAKLEVLCPWAVPPKAKEQYHQSRKPQGDAGESVIEAFNSRHDLRLILERHAYQPRGKRYLRPNSSTGDPGLKIHDANGKAACWSWGGDALNDGKLHDAFDVYRILEHGGDWKAAIKAAAKAIGMDYTSRRQGQSGSRQGTGERPGGGNGANSGNSRNSNAGAHDKESPVPEWPEPLPLRRDIPPPEPFPINELGDVLKPTALAMMEVIQSPAAVCGQSLLAGAALAVQGHADIVIDGRVFPVSNYWVSVAVSGERKTTTDQVALAPHDKRQRDLRRVYQGQLTGYENDLAAWKKAREEALSKANKTLEAKKRALEALGPEPQGPVDAILMVEEPTYEGLVKALARGWPSMGLFSDEGGHFLGGHGMNQDNQLKTASGLSKLWDGSPITRTRGGDGNLLLYGRRLSLHLMIQPAISHLLFGNGLLIGQGLLSRCLVAWPESNIGQHRYVEQDLAKQPAMRCYFGRLLEILETPLPLAEGTLNELAPRQLPLDRQAKAVWVSFHDHISALCAPDRELHPIKGLAAKAAEHAARLAGVLTLVADLQAPAIALPEMEAGIALVEFYLGEALRLFDAAADNPDLELAEKCLTWARARGGRFAAETLYQKGPNVVRDKATADRILQILAKHGLARPLPTGTVVDEKPRKTAWEVRP